MSDMRINNHSVHSITHSFVEQPAKAERQDLAKITERVPLPVAGTTTFSIGKAYNIEPQEGRDLSHLVRGIGVQVHSGKINEFANRRISDTSTVAAPNTRTYSATPPQLDPTISKVLDKALTA